MTYCQVGTNRDGEIVANFTDWFPSSSSACGRALVCVEERLSLSDLKYENTFFKLVGEFSDPLAYVIVQCVDPPAWEVACPAI